jgi:hypothetical protein
MPEMLKDEALMRTPVLELGQEVDDFSTDIIRTRLLPFLKEILPEAYEELCGGGQPEETLISDLVFNEGEPGINRYSQGGYFAPHQVT